MQIGFSLEGATFVKHIICVDPRSSAVVVFLLLLAPGFQLLAPSK
jgi:hypothetical protein